MLHRGCGAQVQLVGRKMDSSGNGEPRQTEKIVLLLPKLGGLPMDLAAVLDSINCLHLIIAKISLAPNAIVACVIFLVDVTLHNILQKAAHRFARDSASAGRIKPPHHVKQM